MPHQCTRCGEIYPDANEVLLKGCSCGSRFFYYIKQEKFEELRNEMRQTLAELEKADKDQIEKDIRELTGLDEEPDKPVILDLESIRVIKPGKFEIDVVNLFSKQRPIIYKLGEGKYIIDLASSLKIDKEAIEKKIKNPLESKSEKIFEEKIDDLIEEGDEEIDEVENFEIEGELNEEIEIDDKEISDEESEENEIEKVSDFDKTIEKSEFEGDENFDEEDEENENMANENFDKKNENELSKGENEK